MKTAFAQLRTLAALEARRLENRLRPVGVRRRSQAQRRVGTTLANLATALTLTLVVVRGLRPALEDATALGNFLALSAFQLSLLVSSSVLLMLGTIRTKDDGEQLWLSSLPLPAETLFCHRVIVLAGSRLPWAAPVWALLFSIAAANQGALAAAFMSLLLAIPLHLFACAAAVAGVFLLRSRLSGPWVGRLQVGSLLLGAAVATVIVSPSLVTETADLQVILSRFAAPELPPTMLVHLLLASFPARALLLGGVLGLQWLAGMAFLIWVGSAFTQRAAAVKEGEREVAPRGVAAGSVRGSVLSRFPSLGAFSRRDSRLLLRDGRRLIQGVSPLLVVAACVVGAMMGGAKGIATSAVAAQFIALGTAMMVILWAGPNILGNERGATWILLILPLDLRRFLARRSFSIGLRGALLAAVVTLSLAHDRGAPAVWRAIAWAAVASALCSPLATSIAVLTFDGKSERPDQARLAAHLWVFFGVGLVLIGTVLMAPLAIKLSTLACLFLFVLGFWQRATHRLPLLLDVDDGWRQRRQPYAGDALVSLLAFLLIQQTVAHLLETDLLFLREILSGLATVVVTTVWLRHRKARVVPLVPAKRAASCLMGAVGGAIALGSVILIHLAARKHWPDLVPFWLGQGARVTDADLWLFSIVAVPVEEFVFRGVIYPALRTSMRVLPSVAISAVIFMVMHQPASAGPALLLGALCAVRVERDGALAGAMITHLIYNLGICAFRM